MMWRSGGTDVSSSRWRIEAVEQALEQAVEQTVEQNQR